MNPVGWVGLNEGETQPNIVPECVGSRYLDPTYAAVNLAWGVIQFKASMALSLEFVGLEDLSPHPLSSQERGARFPLPCQGRGSGG